MCSKLPSKYIFKNVTLQHVTKISISSVTQMAESSKINAAYTAIVCWFIVSNLPDPTSGKCKVILLCESNLHQTSFSIYVSASTMNALMGYQVLKF